MVIVHGVWKSELKKIIQLLYADEILDRDIKAKITHNEDFLPFAFRWSRICFNCSVRSI